MKKNTRAFARPAALLALAVAQSACGWVDTGVNGNQPPNTSKARDVYEVAEGATLSVKAPGVLANDVDGGNTALRAKLITRTQHGSLRVQTDADGLFDGGFEYTNDGTDGASEDGFTYQAYDGIDYSQDTPVRIVIKPVNDKPVAAADSATVHQGDAVDIDLLGNDADPEGDPLSAEILTQPTHGTLTVLADGSVRYQHDGSAPLGDAATDSFTYRATDGKDVSEPATVTISIINAPPVAADDSATVDHAGTVTIDVLANDKDPEGNPLSITIVTPPAHGSAAVSGQSIVYTQDGSNATADTLTYTASDGVTSSNTASVTITINSAPQAVDDSYTVAEAGTLDEAAPGVLQNDVGLTAPVTLSIDAAPAHASALVLHNDGSFSYTHDGSETSSDSFRYRVQDAAGADLTATVQIAITPVNDPPIAGNVCTDVGRDGIGTITLPGSDAETPAGALTYAVTQPQHGRVDTTNTASVTYTPDANAPWGADSFTYTVTDGDGATATGSVDVIIRPRIMPLGDSITNGEYDQYDPDGSSPSARAGYRKPLWDALAQNGYAVDFVGSTANGPTSGFDRDNEGHSGIRSRAYSDAYLWDGSDPNGVAEHINGWLTQNPADIVLLHIGTNDFNTGKTADQIYAGIQSILANIDNWAASEASVSRVDVLLGQIIGANQPTSFTNAQVRSLDYDLLPGLSGGGVSLVDQYAALAGSDNEPDPARYANTLHPNQSGYDAMASAWQSRLRGVLDARGASCPGS